ncbi:MAG TPA: polysaccharide biosynthesis/export family protein [Myxococcota bacterium]|nr:polysaccharide biosynthesis/export family protein [Myxococcota bacterium]
MDRVRDHADSRTPRGRRASSLGRVALVGLVANGLACGWNPFAYWPAADPMAPLPPVRVVGEAREYRIGVPDRLELTVWQHPDVSGELLVRRDGKVSVPLMGDIQAEGLTPLELADHIRAALSDYIADPRVDIAVIEMRSQVASVIGGGILRSGQVELQRNTRVVDAIAAMGGLTPFAKKRRIRILRETPEGQVEYPFDYSAFIRGNAPASNILLEPGDTIIVPE